LHYQPPHAASAAARQPRQPPLMAFAAVIAPYDSFHCWQYKIADIFHSRYYDSRYDCRYCWYALRLH
jgi:hypothetical protein